MGDDPGRRRVHRRHGRAGATGGAQENSTSRISYAANRGGGAAIRGRARLLGDPLLITDTDFDALAEWVKLAERLPTHPISIGSRGMEQDLVRRRQAFHRVLLGKVGNGIIQIFAVPGIQDTQCGFKLFPRRPGARPRRTRARPRTVLARRAARSAAGQEPAQRKTPARPRGCTALRTVAPKTTRVPERSFPISSCGFCVPGSILPYSENATSNDCFRPRWL